MKTILGKFTQSDGKPAANATLTLKLDQTAHTIIKGGAELEWPDDYEKSVQLTAGGEIPPGVTILANDEIAPGGTDYKVRVFEPESEGGPLPLTHFRGWLEIVGNSPIDLNTLDPALYPQPAPEPEPVLPPLPPRKPGVNYSGFFGGTVYSPGVFGSISIDSSLTGSAGRPLSRFAKFDTIPFFLPFKAIVSRVSIFVDVPHLGNSVVVELQDPSGERRCGATIDVSKDGLASATFESVALNPGEYLLAWTARFPSSTLKLRGAGGCVQAYFKA